MTIEILPGSGTGVEVLASPENIAGAVEVLGGGGATVIEVTGASGTTVEVFSAVVGLPGQPGLSFIVVAPGDDPPPGTPDRTFVFEGPL